MSGDIGPYRGFISLAGPMGVLGRSPEVELYLHAGMR